MKPRASLPRVFGKMRADTVPFIVGQIRGISLAVHGAKLRPPSRSPSTFQTVSLRTRVHKGKKGKGGIICYVPLLIFFARAALKSGMVPKVGTPENCSSFSGECRPLR